MSFAPGARLGSFEILSPIGSGGMGDVYRAKDLKLGRDVAIKVLPEELATDPDRLKRFEQEARSASALNHPNIVTIHAIDKHDSTPYIAMEYVEGKTLRKVLGDGPLPTKKLLKIATQTADGLAKAQSAGIVHRDLKPENVMVTDDGFVKILDFGLAKLLPEAKDYDSEMTTMTRELTREGVIVGTVGYMSPEQASGRLLDHRSDQFAFGAILYEMATGKVAFRRETAAQALAAIIEGEPEPIAKVNPKVPNHLRVIVGRCLAKEPGQRYESTRDLARDLEGSREKPFEFPAILTRRTVLSGVAALWVLGLSLILGLNVGGLRDRLLGQPGSTPIDSLAVLPLTNQSGDPEQEYFVDGVTEALITDLAKISALKVISRNSSMRYKETDKTIPEIAEELGLDALIEGSVLRVGDRVRVTAQLIEARTDQYLWADSFDRELRDILALYSSVAQTIANAIEIAVTPEEETRLASARPVDPEAYDLYVRGRYHFSRMPGGLVKANELFQQSVAKDPSYAQAYAALASSYFLIGNYYLLPPKDVFPKGKAAALKAQEIDDTLVETQKALAIAKFRTDWDWHGFARHITRAIELNPGDSDAHNWYAQHLSQIGRHDEAIAEMRKAWELDPNSLYTGVWVGVILYFARQYDQAIQHLQKITELYPDYGETYFWLSMAYLQEGMFTEAVEEAEKGVELSDGTEGTSWLTYAYTVAGRDEARHLLHELERGQPSSGWIAAVYTALGDKDQAFAWLDKAYDRYDSWLFMLHDPLWDPLRDDPRFKELLRRINSPLL